MGGRVSMISTPIQAASRFEVKLMRWGPPANDRRPVGSDAGQCDVRCTTAPGTASANIPVAPFRQLIRAVTGREDRDEQMAEGWKEVGCSR